MPPEAVTVLLYAEPTVAPGRVDVVIANRLGETDFEFKVKEPHPDKRAATPSKK